MTSGEIYHDIAQRILAAIPENWTSANLKVQWMHNFMSRSGTYIAMSSENKKIDSSYFRAPFFDNISFLHAITTDNGKSKNKWNTLEFSLTPDGKFDILFSWDQTFQDKYSDSR